jgi:DNA-binding response OmpR family regulator
VTSGPSEPDVAVRTGMRTALIVEDDMLAADLIRLQLETEGFQVLHALSAEAALILAVQQPLALITLDIILPTMDAWEFLDRIKQISSLARVPVVIISMLSARTKAFALGVAAVMQKPISRDELHDVLDELGLIPVSLTQTLKVLVVDDDPKAVELIAVRIMSMAGSVLRAYGGQEAIEMARRELPDLIVLDIMMPDVNGVTVARRAQRASRHRAHSHFDGHLQAAHQRGSGRAHRLRHRDHGAVPRRHRPLRDRGATRGLRPPEGRLKWPESWSSRTTPPT